MSEFLGMDIIEAPGIPADEMLVFSGLRMVPKSIEERDGKTIFRWEMQYLDVVRVVGIAPPRRQEGA